MDAQHKRSKKHRRKLCAHRDRKADNKNMTRSAKGSKEKPGKNIAQKSGLNREILDTAPAQLLAMVRYKVEETGSESIEPSSLITELISAAF